MRHETFAVRSSHTTVRYSSEASSQGLAQHVRYGYSFEYCKPFLVRESVPVRIPDRQYHRRADSDYLMPAQKCPRPVVATRLTVPPTT
eukprot:scaffold681680_cov64-Prasinocladus_malaysianus.AAC.1